MKHPTRCEKATHTKCKCRCGGRLHGIHSQTNDNFTRPINEHIGGQLADMMKALRNRTFNCTCGRVVTITDFQAYPHEGGLSDKHGKKWWLYVTCPHCALQWSWHKLKLRTTRNLYKMGDSYED